MSRFSVYGCPTLGANNCNVVLIRALGIRECKLRQNKLSLDTSNIFNATDSQNTDDLCKTLIKEILLIVSVLSLMLLFHNNYVVALEFDKILRNTKNRVITWGLIWQTVHTLGSHSVWLLLWNDGLFILFHDVHDIKACWISCPLWSPTISHQTPIFSSLALPFYV